MVELLNLLLTCIVPSLSLLERTLVALWFADIAGYSEHAAKDESGALRLVEISSTASFRKSPTIQGTARKVCR
jgi:hypothetical protein